MNNKIHELAIEADEWMSNTTNWRHIPGNPNIIRDCKFAELIVHECAKIADDGYGSDHFGNGIAGYQLLQYFGFK